MKQMLKAYSKVKMGVLDDCILCKNYKCSKNKFVRRIMTIGTSTHATSIASVPTIQRTLTSITSLVWGSKSK